MSPAVLAIRAPDALADLVASTAVLAAAVASERFEGVRILARPDRVGLLSGGALAAHVVEVGPHVASQVRAYRELGATAALVLDRAPASTIAAWRARVAIRAGPGHGGRRWLLTHAVLPLSREGRCLPVPPGDGFRDVAGLLGIAVPDPAPVLAERPEIGSEQRARLADLGVDAQRGYVLCCPGARFGEGGLWAPERFAAVLDALQLEHGWGGVVTGASGEETVVGAVAAVSRRGAVSLAREPRRLEQLVALVRGARLVLTGAAGPRAIAAALGVPCVALEGPRASLGAIGARDVGLRVAGLECAPCAQSVCALQHQRCLRDLAPDVVTRAALALAGVA